MAKALVPGALYEHFKGNLYLALTIGRVGNFKSPDQFFSIAKYCEDDSIEVHLFYGSDGTFKIQGDVPSGEYVVYEQLYDAEKYKKHSRWVRSLEDFLGTKIINGKEVERFKHVGHYNQPGTGCY